MSSKINVGLLTKIIEKFYLNGNIKKFKVLTENGATEFVGVNDDGNLKSTLINKTPLFDEGCYFAMLDPKYVKNTLGVLGEEAEMDIEDVSLVISDAETTVKHNLVDDSVVSNFRFSKLVQSLSDDEKVISFSITPELKTKLNKVISASSRATECYFDFTKSGKVRFVSGYASDTNDKIIVDITKNVTLNNPGTLIKFNIDYVKSVFSNLSDSSSVIVDVSSAVMIIGADYPEYKCVYTIPSME